MFQKTILRDKAGVDVFKGMLGAVNPVQGIVGGYFIYDPQLSARIWLILWKVLGQLFIYFFNS